LNRSAIVTAVDGKARSNILSLDRLDLLDQLREAENIEDQYLLSPDEGIA
jgi:hypothetical protein